jgi:hypothetical protein
MASRKAMRTMQRAYDHPDRRARHLKIGVAASGLVLIFVLWTVVAISVLFARQAALQRARSDAANLSAAFTDEVSHILDSVSAAMELIAIKMRVDGSSFDIQAWARSIPLMAAPTIQGSIIGPDGKLVSTTLDPRPQPIDLNDREHFRAHLDGSFNGLFISRPVIGRVSRQPTIQVSKRVETNDGRFLGVLVFSLARQSYHSLQSREPW